MYKKLMVISPIVLALLLAAAMYFGLFASLENIVYDNLLQTEREPVKNIIIVGMDERSLDEIGTWPWPRFFMADTIDKLSDLGAAAIGVDILYDAYGADPEYDQMLVDAAARSGRVVFGAAGIFWDDNMEQLRADEYIVPFDELNDVAATGFLNVIPDAADGAIRKAVASFSYGDITVTSFPIEVYRMYCRSLGLDDSLDIPVNRFGQYNIDYVGKPFTYTEVSLWGVINNEYPPDIFKDAICLVGPYTIGIGMDDYYTAIDHGTKMYGIEIHANTIQNLMEQNFKADADWYWNLIGLALFCLLAVFLWGRLKYLWALASAVLMIALQLGAAFIFYTAFDLVIVSSYSLLFLITAYLMHLFLSMLSVSREKAHIRGLFGRFVSEDVVREIISGNVSIELGGILREVTLLFVDIRGFTAFSEANPPGKVVEMVNQYLELTSNSIQDNGGTIDKYIGDATMAVFNAPNDLPNHELCAVKAAWAMKVGSADLREQILKDYGVDLQFGIGVNTGPAIVGNMGSTFRMDYTVIGDTVNTAARLEANAAKGQIIISKAVYDIIKEHVEVEDKGILMVKNKKEGIHIYEVTGMKL